MVLNTNLTSYGKIVSKSVKNWSLGPRADGYFLQPNAGSLWEAVDFASSLAINYIKVNIRVVIMDQTEKATNWMLFMHESSKVSDFRDAVIGRLKLLSVMRTDCNYAIK